MHRDDLRHGTPSSHRARYPSPYSSWRRHQKPLSLRPSGAGRATRTCPTRRRHLVRRPSRCGRRRRPRARMRSGQAPLFCRSRGLFRGPRRSRSVWQTLLRGTIVGSVKVVIDRPGLPFLPGVRDVEVVVEVALERRRPRKAPAHPPLVRLELSQRRAGHGRQGDIVIARCTTEPEKPSAMDEQEGQPAV